VLFQRRKFGFVHYHPKVVSLKVVIGNVFHANLVFGIAEKSHEFFKGSSRLWRNRAENAGDHAG
jgi:hypothetical protein